MHLRLPHLVPNREDYLNRNRHLLDEATISIDPEGNNLIAHSKSFVVCGRSEYVHDGHEYYKIKDIEPSVKEEPISQLDVTGERTIDFSSSQVQNLQSYFEQTQRRSRRRKKIGQGHSIITIPILVYTLSF